MQGRKYNRLVGVVVLNMALLASTKALSVEVSSGGYGRDATGYIEAAGIRFTPRLYMGVGYDDNIYKSKSLVTSSSTFSASPSLEARITSGVNLYRMQFNIHSIRYPSGRKLDYTNYGAKFDIHHEFTRRHRLDINLYAAELHVPNSIGPDKGTDPLSVSAADGRDPSKLNRQRPIEFIKQSVDIRYGFGNKLARAQSEVFLNLDGRQHKKMKSADAGIKMLGYNFHYRLMPKTKMLLETNLRNMVYDSRQSVNSAGVREEDVYQKFNVKTYLVGLTWDSTAKTTSYFKAGQRFRVTDVRSVPTKNSGAGKETMNVLEAGMTYNPRPHSVVQLYVVRDYSYESDDPASATFTKLVNGIISWEHGWTERYRTYVALDIMKGETQNAFGELLRYRDTSVLYVALSWRLRRWLSVNVGFRHEDRKDDIQMIDDSIIDGTYIRNIFNINVAIIL